MSLGRCSQDCYQSLFLSTGCFLPHPDKNLRYPSGEENSITTKHSVKMTSCENQLSWLERKIPKQKLSTTDLVDT